MSPARTETTPAPASGSVANPNGTSSGKLAVAGFAGVLASACCIGPLVLAAVGLGGAAAGVVAVFEPLRLVFIAAAFAALGFAGWKIYRRPVVTCEPGTACAQPQSARFDKKMFWVVAAIVLALIASPYYIGFFY